MCFRGSLLCNRLLLSSSLLFSCFVLMPREAVTLASRNCPPAAPSFGLLHILLSFVLFAGLRLQEASFGHAQTSFFTRTSTTPGKRVSIVAFLEPLGSLSMPFWNPQGPYHCLFGVPSVPIIAFLESVGSLSLPFCNP